MTTVPSAWYSEANSDLSISRRNTVKILFVISDPFRIIQHFTGKDFFAWNLEKDAHSRNHVLTLIELDLLTLLFLVSMRLRFHLGKLYSEVSYLVRERNWERDIYRRFSCRCRVSLSCRFPQISKWDSLMKFIVFSVFLSLF